MFCLLFVPSGNVLAGTYLATKMMMRARACASYCAGLFSVREVDMCLFVL